jgi:hypothetical protein
MLTRVNWFGTQNAADIAAAPPTVADAVTKLSKAASDQVGCSGDFHEGAASKSVQRELLLAELRGINKSAIAISASQNTPQILEKFRLTSEHNDTALADAAETMQPSFIELGHDANFVQNLRNDVTAFNSAAEDKNLGAQARSGRDGQRGAAGEPGFDGGKAIGRDHAQSLQRERGENGRMGNSQSHQAEATR